MKYFFTFLIFLSLLLLGCQTSTKKKIPRVNEYEVGQKDYGGGEYDRAVQNYNQWLVKYPKDASAYAQRGKAYDKMNMQESALVDYSKSLKIAPGYLTPWVYKTGTLVSLKKYTEARQNINKLMTHPNFAQLPAYEQFMVFLLDGQLKLQEKQPGAAIASLNRSLQIYNSDTTSFVAKGSPVIFRFSLYYRAVAHYTLQDYAKSAQDMQDYIMVTEKGGYQVDSKDYTSLALSWYMTGELEKCRSVLPKIPRADRERLGQILGERFSEVK